jgi:hypothetical protein
LLRFWGDVFGVFGWHGDNAIIVVHGVVEFVWNEQQQQQQ